MRMLCTAALVVLGASAGCQRAAVPRSNRPRSGPVPTTQARVHSPQAEAPAPAQQLAQPSPESQANAAQAATALFFSSAQDPLPQQRGGVTRERVDKQYLAGNEKKLHAFYEHTKDLGGGYVGVGSDQAYLFIGWARPSFAWLIDYDPDVVAIHSVYRVLFAAASTPQELLELWGKERRKEVANMIALAVPGADGQALRALYLRHRGWIERRLRAQAKRLEKLKLPSYLTDTETFEFVKAQLTTQRIRAIPANLHGDAAVLGIAKVATQLEVPIRLLYLSNAEEYWKRYPQQYRDNVTALPHDERSVVVRTLLIWDVNQDYRYNVQSLANYKDWLAANYVRNIYDVVHKRPKPEKDGLNFFWTTGAPADSPRARAQGSKEPGNS